MSSELEKNKIDESRIKILKKVNNPNYNSEYYNANKETLLEYQRVNKVKCNVCEVILTMASRKHHVVSAKHKLKLLETGKKFENPEDCFIRVKIEDKQDQLT